jgi:late competence protein required for DNA uptake (superfamily II DNA/RNA helicase)
VSPLPSTPTLQGIPWCGRTPREWQPEALAALLAAWREKKRPLIQAATGSGKSLLLAEIAAQGRGSVLVTTPTQALVDQLYASISGRLPGEVGRVYQHCWEADRRVVVVCTASLGKLLDERPEWGCWIADEAHRMEAESLRKITARIKSRVSVGLTATPYRADGRGMRNWSGQVYAYPSARAVDDGVLVPWRAVRWDGSGNPTTDELVKDWVEHAEGPGIVSAVSIADAETYAQRLGPTAAAIHDEHNAATRAALIEALRVGRLHCLVHVNLLTEGVDLPWLRWLAMRRRVGSIVRLVQEVGRVLRASPDKDHAVLYDPYNLLGKLGLTHAAALEDALTTEAVRGEPEDWMIPGLNQDNISQLPSPVKVEMLEGWVTDLVGACRAYNLAAPPKFGHGPWRTKAASEKQLTRLKTLCQWARYFPKTEHRDRFRMFANRPELEQGPASDMIDVMLAFRDAGAHARRTGANWRPPFAIPEILPPTETACGS